MSIRVATVSFYYCCFCFRPNRETSLTERNSRKRLRNVENWKRNVRHLKHQAGESYISVRGKTVAKKCIKNKKDCFTSCKMNCSKIITEEQRLEIFLSYYDMNQNEKYHFILQTSERNSKKRSTCNSNRKQFSYMYYFNTQGVLKRVCKQFYLGTLDISQKMVYNVHEKRDLNTGAPKKDHRGKHGKQKHTTAEKLNEVRMHIKSFPVVEAHYCRSTTKRRYLESNLSISKMYDLYKESTEAPVLKSMYSKIFNEEFNLSFHKPKKDKCDLCSEWEMSRKERILTSELDEKRTIHIAEKNAMRLERHRDRDSAENVLCFDLQNVLTCPQADVSCFFYKSKLNVYNLTGHFSKTKKTYCALWTEATSGRTGNDLASALLMILRQLLKDNTDIESLTLWSDSCVPQNRNSYISYALADFMKENENINQIIVKYCTPGHSAIQEVDNVHSCIEKVLSVSEYYSPVSLIKLLKKVHKNNPYRIIQLQNEDIKDFAECTKSLNYSQVPYSKVTSLKFTQNYFYVSYKMSYLDEDWIGVNILPSLMNRPRRRGQNNHRNVLQFPRDMPIPQPIRSAKKGLPEHKVQAIKSMYKWMPLLDKTYYQALFREIDV